MYQEKKTQSIGALWGRKTKKGDDYFSGTYEFHLPSGEIVKQNFVAFKNFQKKTERHPDFVIRPREEQTQQISQYQPIISPQSTSGNPQLF